jgi:hypothetical protein
VEYPLRCSRNIVELAQNSTFSWRRVLGGGGVWLQKVGAELRKLKQSSPKQTLNLLRSKPIVIMKVHGMQDNIKL